MKNKLFIQMSAVFLIAAMLSSVLFSLPVSAASENCSLSGIDSRTTLQSLSVVEDNFNVATVGWIVNGANAKSVSASDNASLPIYEGSRSLSLSCSNYKKGSIITLSKRPSYMSSTETYRYYSVTVWIPEEAEGINISISVSSAGRTFSSSMSVLASGWQTLFFDATKSGSYGKATAVRISFSAMKSGDFNFMLDVFGASDSKNAIKNARFLSSSYTATNCELTQNNSSAKISLNQSNSYIETSNLAVSDFSENTGIRITLANNSSCRSLSLHYSSAVSEDYNTRQLASCEISSGDTVSCVFPILTSNVEKIKLVFDGSCSGDIEILSISQTPCYSVSEYLNGKISECVISRDKKRISLKGFVNRDSLNLSVKYSVGLYELELWESADSLTLNSIPLYVSELKGSDFSFSLQLSEEKNNLFKKYAAAVILPDKLVIIGSPVSISNPEILADDAASFSPLSIKGIANLESSAVLDGVSHTTVEIRLDEILTLGSSNVITHSSGDSSCTINSDYIEELDRKMTDYQNCGINVIFILRSGYKDVSLNSIINHPLSNEGRFSAFNTESKEGIGTLRAICDYLVNRYSSSYGITSNAEGFSVGMSVNNAFTEYNLGKASFSDTVYAYSNAIRTVYNSVRSVSPEVSVYMSLGGIWFSGMSPMQTSFFDAKSMLESVCDCISAGGNIEWGLSYDIFDKNKYYWELSSSPSSENAYSINIQNLEILTNFMKKERLLYGGSERSLVLIETDTKEATNQNEIINASADYACSYLKISKKEFSHIKAFIPSRSVNYNETLKYIDTDKMSEHTEYVREIVGNELFEKLASGSLNATRTVHEKVASDSVPSAVKGELVLFDFGEDSAGWQPLVNCASIKGGASLGDQHSLLSIRLEDALPQEYRGIHYKFEKSVDLSSVQYIGLDVQVAVLPEGVDSLEISIAVWSGNSFSMSSKTIKAGEKSTVIADISDFYKASSCDRISIVARGEGDQSIGEPTLLISNVRALSDIKASDELSASVFSSNEDGSKKPVGIYTVSAVCIILLFSLTVEIIRIKTRKKQNQSA